MIIKFYDQVEDELIKFAVIFSRYQGKWVYCRHKERSTYEVPGGHRELGESIEMAARRELYEESGAVEYDIKPVCVYSVEGKTRVDQSGEESFGMLFMQISSDLKSYLVMKLKKLDFLKTYQGS